MAVQLLEIALALWLVLFIKKRAIPIAWLNVEGKKGHFCEAVHVQLLKQVKTMIPDEAEVVILGDGEFDGLDFLTCCYRTHNKFPCKNRIFGIKKSFFNMYSISLNPSCNKLRSHLSVL